MVVLIDMVWDDQVRMKTYSPFKDDYCYLSSCVIVFIDTSNTTKIKSKSLQLINLLTLLSSQQGAVISAGKMQVHEQQQPAAAMNLCGVTASAQHWQKQPACDNSSWVDGESVKVTDATTDTTGFCTRTEHHHVSTPTQRHKCWLSASIIRAQHNMYS